jgi:hypothetical protein
MCINHSFVPSIYIEKYANQWNISKSRDVDDVRDKLLEKSVRKVLDKYHLDDGTMVRIGSPQYDMQKLRQMGFTATSYKRLFVEMEVTARDLLDKLHPLGARRYTPSL